MLLLYLTLTDVNYTESCAYLCLLHTNPSHGWVLVTYLVLS